MLLLQTNSGLTKAPYLAFPRTQLEEVTVPALRRARHERDHVVPLLALPRVPSLEHMTVHEITWFPEEWSINCNTSALKI